MLRKNVNFSSNHFNAMNKKHLNTSSILFRSPLKQVDMLKENKEQSNFSFYLLNIISKKQNNFVQIRFLNNICRKGQKSNTLNSKTRK